MICYLLIAGLYYKVLPRFSIGVRLTWNVFSTSQYSTVRRAICCRLGVQLRRSWLVNLLSQPLIADVSVPSHSCNGGGPDILALQLFSLFKRDNKARLSFVYLVQTHTAVSCALLPRSSKIFCRKWWTFHFRALIFLSCSHSPGRSCHSLKRSEGDRKSRHYLKLWNCSLEVSLGVATPVNCGWLWLLDSAIE